MRPRSRLLSKRRLTLPTIKEGAEETVKDLNEANTLLLSNHSQAVSSEDYLLSICHLARPTFPARDVSPDSFHTRQENTAQHRLRPSRLIRTTLNTFEFNLKEKPQTNHVLQDEKKELNEELLYGNSDPLEYLYGHQNNISALSGTGEGRFARQHGSVWRSNRANSIPHASNADIPCHRKSSCPEIQTNTNISVPNVSPKHSFSGSEVIGRACPKDRVAEGEKLNPVVKHSLISRWISDCRSAWRETRLRACMLPAIAEV
ncbi:uncharacterized protein si:dkeyp-72g9.4 [Cololabis saira]|uniref:uncharacterized protein si:dkeyp-72g9.4 n=1 Tax=Cololabis saira TaxID=129043 RepID=UPI002AD3E816|nr:uncharacterized protein si:dkeyp-72g9.4 [Cololabis saira]